MASLSEMTLSDYNSLQDKYPPMALDLPEGRIVLATVCTHCDGVGEVRSRDFTLLQPKPDKCLVCPACVGRRYRYTEAGKQLIAFMDFVKAWGSTGGLPTPAEDADRSLGIVTL